MNSNSLFAQQVAISNEDKVDSLTFALSLVGLVASISLFSAGAIDASAVTSLLVI